MRLWQRPGESYGHVLLKALGYAMFVGEYPGLEIELSVGLRYKPDLVALNVAGGGRLSLVNFAADIAERASDRRIKRVPDSWYTKTTV